LHTPSFEKKLLPSLSQAALFLIGLHLEFIDLISPTHSPVGSDVEPGLEVGGMVGDMLGAEVSSSPSSPVVGRGSVVGRGVGRGARTASSSVVGFRVGAAPLQTSLTLQPSSTPTMHQERVKEVLAGDFLLQLVLALIPHPSLRTPVSAVEPLGTFCMVWPLTPEQPSFQHVKKLSP